MALVVNFVTCKREENIGFTITRRKACASAIQFSGQFNQS